VDELISRETDDKKMRRLAKSIVVCENPTLDPERQSDYVFKHDHSEKGQPAGSRERSYGLIQLHAPSWPDISLEQMKDPSFSIHFLVERLEDGDEHLWLTCSEKAKTP